MLSQLLTELDGIQVSLHPSYLPTAFEYFISSINVAMSVFQGLKQVIVIAATNRPDLLDAALSRPGRIDRKVKKISNSSEKGNIGLLNMYELIPSLSSPFLK